MNNLQYHPASAIFRDTWITGCLVLLLGFALDQERIRKHAGMLSQNLFPLFQILLLLYKSPMQRNIIAAGIQYVKKYLMV